MKLILWWSFCFSLDFAVKCQENLYGQKGKSVRLSISPRYQQADTEWRRFQRTEIVAKPNGVSPTFESRMTLNVSDWSLTFQNLQVNDSGLYEALQNWERDTVAAFLLIVENPVSEPVIRVKDYNSSDGACQASVNCSVDGSWAAYDCDQYHCEKTHDSLSSMNITVSTLDRSIQCHANNHVSQNHSTTPNIMCYEKQHSDLPSSPKLTWITVAVGVSLFLFMALTVVTVFVKKRVSSKVHPQSSCPVIDGTVITVSEHHQTIYSTVQKQSAAQMPPKHDTETTVYDVPSRRVQSAAHRTESVEVMIENQEQRQPEHETTVKVTATVHQAAEPDSDQINTIYCKLGEI